MVDSLTVAIVGSGGAGVVSMGEMLLKAAARLGFYGLMRKSFGPQIRGGESAAIIRISNRPVGNFNGHVHCLVALDWNNFSRFDDEIPISINTAVLQDTSAGTPPGSINIEKITTLDFTQAAKDAESDKPNMALLGYLAAWLGCSTHDLEQFIRQRLQKFDDAIQSVSVAAMKNGVELAAMYPLKLTIPVIEDKNTPLWIATGNQLAGLGVLEAGVRFVAAYPITPASDCLEWIANHIKSVGGNLVQAEDELSAINMIIGAAYSGVPSMTATSGPGLSLMSEAMGLAVASETPVVVLNVMRGGPSTGIPTKSEQSDLNIALYGLHGDAPHLVLSALSIEDCFYTLSWAVQLSQSLQTLAIVLSDQFLGQSSQIMDELPPVPFKAEPLAAPAVDEHYARYEDTESGVSPRAVPGLDECMYTADGLEHSENAVPSPKASDHQKQLDKRQRKLTLHDYGESWAEIKGDQACKTVIICWGSLHATLIEAQHILAKQNMAVKIISVRLLSPLPQEKLLAACEGAQKILVVEQNHQGQFAHYLRSLGMRNFEFESFAKPGPSLITADDIIQCLAPTGEASDETQSI